VGKLRLVVVGQAAFGAKVLEALAQKEEVLVAFTPPGGRGEPVLAAGARLGVPVYQPARMKDPEVLTTIRGLGADLGVMAFVTDHPSLLPRHRGASAINWAIIQGDQKTGLTIFWPDAGIDTGPILLQKEVGIGPDDTVGSLYFEKLFPLGVNALVEAVELVKAGRAPRLPQEEALATYEPPCAEEHAWIDWAQPVQQVYNLIRGTSPQPGATTRFRGQKLKVYDSQQKGAAAAPPGQVVAVDSQGFQIACRDGSILVKRVQPQGGDKIASTEYARQAGLRVGDSLGK